jgi:hypothetical protein
MRHSTAPTPLLLALLALAFAPPAAHARWDRPVTLDGPVKSFGDFTGLGAALADDGTGIVTWSGRAALRRPRRGFGRPAAFPLYLGVRRCRGELVAAGPGRAAGVGFSTVGGLHGTQFGAWRLGRGVPARRLPGDDPCADVALRPSGAGVLAYERPDGALGVRRRFRSGRLSGEKRLPTSATDGLIEEVDVAIGPLGDIAVAWRAAPSHEGERSLYVATRSRTGRWAGPQLLPADGYGPAGHRHAGTPVAVAAGPTEALVLHAYQEGEGLRTARLAAGRFGRPLDRHATVGRGLIGWESLALAMDDRGTAFMLANTGWGGPADETRLELRVRPRGGPTRTPVRLGAPGRFLDIAPAGPGRAVAAWDDWAGGVVATGVTAGGAVRGRRRVTLRGEELPSSMAVSANRAGAALAAWFARDYDEPSNTDQTSRVGAMLGRPFVP